MDKLKLQLGSTVLYKGQHWLAVAYNGNNGLYIMQPERSNKKRMILPKSVEAVINVPPAKLVTLETVDNPQGISSYLVTNDGAVISKRTLRVMKSGHIRELALTQALRQQ
ncbi:hypothetical protein AD45P2_00170 [Alteromonas phage vB_AmaP_AD45-P2]|uniref:Uncharacterized protein n=1 Tax=Pseudorhizobium pelagicum TaxID=1509405 RepID=A0A922NZ58_9HYPH|nr:hypothetical protein [Pseudorhizobium pelagicum]YP_008126006.1 hypothetical protein M610_gp035 [Alteromonas phage vB_AmaP_AD45-P1]AGM46973.1 hypothetical protein AD45P3_00175 [Alteromonas phage vB_AmaP_AD45-P3]AGM47090.1 hypothetical protein AD45P4_00175 [Alteromonas phage vB_AmaP_AD45-P4]AGM47205.1 hypothetical protein AD45P2_00170 [Alteromonas phage vB_AmaP_AD45-P2]AGM46853.1 hypothetical protein AD45P1_00175 [Alteromonas phage vB_AmaP_AD45-P1]KEQ05557.1 hypothetical protein GV68_08485 [